MPKGRPNRKVKPGERERVMRLRAAGMSVERIARRLGTDQETLRKHFAEELEHGADVKLEQLFEWAEKGAKKGNAALIKWLHEKQSAARAAEHLKGRESSPAAPDKPAKPEKLGKKEERQRAAEEVRGKFAPPAAPKLH